MATIGIHPAARASTKAVSDSRGPGKIKQNTLSYILKY